MNGQGDIFSGFVHRAGDAARSGAEFVAHAAEMAKDRVGKFSRKAKAYVAKRIHPQPAGAVIEPCPKNRKAERVAERKAKLLSSRERLKTMPAGPTRDALVHATDRFERNNVAVERARLAEDAYNVGQGDPPEGWERVGVDALWGLGMNPKNFPQMDPKFRPDEHSDGYYAELYKAKSHIFGREQYVLSFRGTQGIKDGVTDVLQAFGVETDHYSRAIKTAQKLKKVLGEGLEITGHSMGGGMAAASGIASGSKAFAINPAGIHPNTLERFGQGNIESLGKKYVSSFITEGEFLDSVQNPGFQRAVLAGVTCVTPSGGCAMAVAGQRAMRDRGTVTFAAPGSVYKLPVLVNAQDVFDGDTPVEGISPGLGGRIANATNPLTKIKLHDTKFVIAGLEQQKADDLIIMRR